MKSDVSLRIVCAVVKYFEYGGMQRTYHRVLTELKDRGHEVIALSNTWDGPHPEDIEVVELSQRSVTNHGLNLAFGQAVQDWCQSKEVDLVVGFNKIPHLDVYYAGDPCYVDFCERRSRGFFYRLTSRYRTMKALEASVFDWGQDADVLLISPIEKARFQTHYDTEDERLHLLPAGIDRDRLDHQLAQSSDRERFIRDIGLDPNDKMIVIVGSGFDTKGVDRLIRSLASLPSELDSFYSLAVVGKGDSQAMGRLAQKLGVGGRCVFVGPRFDVVDFYRHAELLAHPARLENTGTTLIEAMYCGLPVLASECCGFAHHVVQADAGLICPEPFEQETLDGMLLTALLAPQRRKWRTNGARYCRETDLYGLIDAAADFICKKGLAQRSKA